MNFRANRFLWGDPLASEWAGQRAGGPALKTAAPCAEKPCVCKTTRRNIVGGGGVAREQCACVNGFGQATVGRAVAATCTSVRINHAKVTAWLRFPT